MRTEAATRHPGTNGLTSGGVTWGALPTAFNHPKCCHFSLGTTALARRTETSQPESQSRLGLAGCGRMDQSSGCLVERRVLCCQILSLPSGGPQTQVSVRCPPHSPSFELIAVPTPSPIQGSSLVTTAINGGDDNRVC